MFKKKSIVLSDIDENSNRKAVLSLEENSNGIAGVLRLYNFPVELDGVSSLGFYVNQKVYKVGLTYKSHMLYEFSIDQKQIPSQFSCALINVKNAEPKPVLYGSSEGSNDEIYASIITEISKNNSFENTKKTLDAFQVDFVPNEKNEIEREIDSACHSCDSCASCVYKKYFFENVENKSVADEKFAQANSIKFVESDENSVVRDDRENLNKEEIEQSGKMPSFLDKLKPQIDKLFENNPVDDNLQKMIPSSKWVRVEYEDDGDFFVFGLLYDEDNNVKYVCYGVPAVFEEEAPQELAGYPIWLPLNSDNRQGFGYWLTYQDAITGVPVKAVLD